MPVNQSKQSTYGDKSPFSERLVTLVQVVFAVVIGGGLIEFHEILSPPKNTIAFWALVGVYVTSIMSWTGYHSRMEQYPYTPTKLGIFRLYTDMLIVIFYAFLLFAGTSQNTSMESYLWGFSSVFLLYIVSGQLRRKEYNDKRASKQMLLWVFFGALFVVASLFTILIHCTRVDITLLDWIFVFLPLLIMISFRLCHELIQLPWRA